MSKATQWSNRSLSGAWGPGALGGEPSTSSVVRPFSAAGSVPQAAPAGRGEQHGPGPRPKSLPDFLSRLLVRKDGCLVVVRLEEVDWIEAEGNYVRLHDRTASHRYRRTLDALESRLDMRRFVRTHRSAIVNVERILELHPTGSGGYDVLLRDGTRVPLSRGYKKRVFVLLGKE